MTAGVKFSEQVFDGICGRVFGGESIAAITRDKDMPSQRSFYRWLKNDRALARRYSFACSVRGDILADEIVTIADECTDPKRARLQIDARKWKASKMAPKKYGDKVNLEHTGKDGGTIEVASCISALERLGKSIGAKKPLPELPPVPAS